MVSTPLELMTLPLKLTGSQSAYCLSHRLLNPSVNTFPPLRKIHLADLFPSWAFFFSAFTFPDRASITRRLLSLQVVANADPSQFQLSERGMSVWHEISLITRKGNGYFLTGDTIFNFYLRQNRLSRWKPYCQHRQRRVYYGQLDAMRPKELFFHGEIISQPKIIQLDTCHTGPLWDNPVTMICLPRYVGARLNHHLWSSKSLLYNLLRLMQLYYRWKDT